MGTFITRAPSDLERLAAQRSAMHISRDVGTWPPPVQTPERTLSPHQADQIRAALLAAVGPNTKSDVGGLACLAKDMIAAFAVVDAATKQEP